VDPGKGIVRFLHGDGRIEGVGFLVGPRRILTCAHVYEKVQRGNSAQVDFPLVAGGREVTARLEVLRPAQANPKPGRMEDIAVLEIPDDAELPGDLAPLPRSSLPDARLNGRSVELYGFPADLARDHWAKAVLSRGASDGRVQFDQAPGSRPVVKGYSGGPVWDTAAECVVGMVVEINRDGHGEVAAAYMIPVSILNRALGKEKPRPHVFPREWWACKCDRDDEFRSFLAFLEHREPAWDARHPVFFLPGDEEAAHDSFLHRLCRCTRILGRIRTETDGAPNPAFLLNVPWPDARRADYRLPELRDNLFRGIVGPSVYGPTDPAAFADACRGRRFGEYPAVMIYHRIPWIAWDRAAPDVLREYLVDFWAAVPSAHLPPFFLFLCMVTPKPGDRHYRRWRWFRGRSVRSSVEKTLRRLEADGVCVCQGFPELKPVEKRHVDSWFQKWGVTHPEDAALRKELKELFGKRGRAPMARVEGCLRRVIKAANDRHSGLEDLRREVYNP
jgi:V8-like Glu-specific endopeptidase